MGVFQKVGGLSPKRSAHGISGSKLFTCNMGELIPVFARRMIPGDTFKIGCETAVRLFPMKYPIMHEIDVTAHAFFVPSRLLWNKFDKYISGGKTGDFAEPLPKWRPNSDDLQLFSQWDYHGFPIVNYQIPPEGARNLPSDDLRRCYNFIWDEYYRDQNLDDPINTGDDGTAETPPTVWGNNRKILKRRYKKDYFTSALIQRQRGTAPALPIAGTLQLENGLGVSAAQALTITHNMSRSSGDSSVSVVVPNVSSQPTITGTKPAQNIPVSGTMDLGDGVTFDISDLRSVVQLQKWMERNNRAGIRYGEFIKAHFDEDLGDSTLNRPVYIGGTKAPVMVNEVVQTSGTGATPQGNMSGHGLSASDGYIGTYHAKEYGIIMTLLSIMPKPMYEDGIDREWLWTDKEDWYFPEFAHLSEQGIYNCEVLPQGGNPVNADGKPIAGGDLDIWAYQGKYDELRVGRDIVCSEMRVKVPNGNQSLADWHMSRSFTTLPHLNSEFITCNPDTRNFLVRSDKTCLVYHANMVKAIRPLPPIAEPGLMDHF